MKKSFNQDRKIKKNSSSSKYTAVLNHEEDQFLKENGYENLRKVFKVLDKKPV